MSKLWGDKVNLRHITSLYMMTEGGIVDIMATTKDTADISQAEMTVDEYILDEIKLLLEFHAQYKKEPWAGAPEKLLPGEWYSLFNDWCNLRVERNNPNLPICGPIETE